MPEEVPAFLRDRVNLERDLSALNARLFVMASCPPKMTGEELYFTPQPPSQA